MSSRARWLALVSLLNCWLEWCCHPATADQRPLNIIQYLPGESYFALTIHPQEIFKNTHFKKFYDTVNREFHDAAKRAEQEALFNSRPAEPKFLFPHGSTPTIMDVDSLTFQMHSRVSPQGVYLLPVESRIYRFSHPETLNSVKQSIARAYKPTSVPGFPREVYLNIFNRSLQDLKPYAGIAEKARDTPRGIKGQEQPAIPPSKEGLRLTEDERIDRLIEQQKLIEKEEDSKTLPEYEQWKYASAILPLDEQTLIYSQHGEVVAQILGAKQNNPAWAKEYFRTVDMPLNGMLDLKQVRENAKQRVMPRYLSELDPKVLLQLKTIIDQADLAMMVTNLFSGIECLIVFVTPDEAAVTKTAAALEQLRSSGPGLLRPYLAKMDAILPGSSVPLAAELQNILAQAKIEQNGKSVAFRLTYTPEQITKSVQTAIDSLTKVRENLTGIRAVSQAMRRYLQAYRVFPATVVSKEGHPVSWRVQLLPYLGEDKLFKQYNQSEPWDSEANQKVLAQMPAVYRAPGADPKSTMTSYSLPITKGGMHPEAVMKRGVSEQNFNDGTLYTIAIIETETQIPWTKPDDLVIDKTAPLPALGFKDQPTLRVIMASGDIRIIRKNVNSEQLYPWLTPRGGEPRTSAIDVE